MRYATVFSGIEAPTVAMPGWSPVWFAEIDAFPSAVLAHHYPDVPNLGDVTAIDEAAIKAHGPFDVLIGGSPCQDLSVAGKGEGLAGSRSGLFFDQVRIFHAARSIFGPDGPRWLVWENVPGAFSTNAGRDFAVVASELAGCRLDVPADGWGSEGVALGNHGLLEWAVLNAEFFGVAQRRRRVFAVLDTGNWRGRRPVLLERESMRGDSPPRREPGAGASVCPTLCAGVNRTGGHRPPGTDVDTAESLIVLSSGQTNAEVTVDLSPTLNLNRDGAPIIHCDPVADPITAHEAHCTSHAGNNPRPRNVVAVGGQTSHALTAEGHDASEDGTGRGTPIVYDERNVTSPDNRSNPQPGDPCHTLNTRSNSTILTPFVRRLTPRECERLQGFPEIKEEFEIWVSGTAQEHSQLRDAAVAGMSFSTSQAGQEKPVLVRVHINCERRAVEIRSAEKLMCSVSSAEKLSESPLLTLIVNSALALAGLSTTLAKRTPGGKVASPANTTHSTHQNSGNRHVVVSGQEIKEHVNDVESAVSAATKFITSPDGLTRQSSDSLMKILSCCVAHAIAGFIPEITPNKSFCIQIESTKGYTLIPYRNKPADQCPDGPRYKALGNTIARPPLRWILKRIEACA